MNKIPVFDNSAPRPLTPLAAPASRVVPSAGMRFGLLLQQAIVDRRELQQMVNDVTRQIKK